MPTEGRHQWEAWVNRIGEHMLLEELTLAGRFHKSKIKELDLSSLLLCSIRA